MRFTSVIRVEQTAEEVWEFLADPLNSAKWDKSVASVILPDSGFTGKGCVVETVAPSGMRQSFVVTEFQAPTFFKFQLLQSSMFKDANLSFSVEPIAEGTRIAHEINLTLFRRSFFLYPILRLTQKRALRRDLEFLRSALKEYGTASTTR